MSSLQEATKVAGLATRRVALIQELEAIDRKLGWGGGRSIRSSSSETTKESSKDSDKPKRGRPKGSKNKPKGESNGHSSNGNGHAKAPKTAKVKSKVKLPDLILEVLGEAKEALTIAEITKAVAKKATSRGYKSNAKNFGNMVYQSLYKLTGNDTIHKEEVENEKVYSPTVQA